MKPFFRLLGTMLFAPLVFGAAGDIALRYNPTGNAWIEPAFSGGANKLIGTSAAGAPSLVSPGSGLSLSSGTLIVSSDAGLPNQAGNSGKALTTNGSVSSWTSALTGMTYNGLSIAATNGTLAITNGKVVSVSNTLTFAGTDGTTQTFPSTSATLARTDAANTFTGHQTIEGVTSTGATGSGRFVFDTSPALITPNIGVATAASLTGAPGADLLISAPAGNHDIELVPMKSTNGFSGTSTSTALIVYLPTQNNTVGLNAYRAGYGSCVLALNGSGGNVVVGGHTDDGVHVLQVVGSISTTTSVTSGAPNSGTAAPWKLGVAVTTTGLTLSTTVYLQADISGTLYKIATVN